MEYKTSTLSGRDWGDTTVRTPGANGIHWLRCGLGGTLSSHLIKCSLYIHPIISLYLIIKIHLHLHLGQSTQNSLGELKKCGEATFRLSGGHRVVNIYLWPLWLLASSLPSLEQPLRKHIVQWPETWSKNWEWPRGARPLDVWWWQRQSFAPLITTASDK